MVFGGEGDLGGAGTLGAEVGSLERAGEEYALQSGSVWLGKSQR